MLNDARNEFAVSESLASGWASTTISVFNGTAVQAKQLAGVIPLAVAGSFGDRTTLVIEFPTLPSGGGITTIGAALMLSASDALSSALTDGAGAPNAFNRTLWSSYDLTHLGRATSSIVAGKPVWRVRLGPMEKIPAAFLSLVLFANAAPTAGVAAARLTNDASMWDLYADAVN